MRRTPPPRVDGYPGFDTLWGSGNFTGKYRPIARVTIQRPNMTLLDFAGVSTFSKRKPTTSGMSEILNTDTIDPTRGQRVENTYADFLFQNRAAPKEMPNVRSVSWERTTEADVATGTVVLWNTKPLPIGEVPSPGDLDQPGYYTFNRGTAAFSSTWGHEANEWAGLLMPDNLLRTYEGYGFDPDLPPESDPNLMLTGVWMIDKVRLGSNGTIRISMRDIGRLLIEHIAWLPVVPNHFYPLSFQDWGGRFATGAITAPTRSEVAMTVFRSSNIFWDPPGPEHNGVLSGHRPSDAFDSNGESYWLSIGNSEPNRRFAYEWIEGNVPRTTVHELRFRTVKSGYTAYASVMINGVWQGANTINYNREGVGRNDSDIKYVGSVAVNSEAEHVIQLGSGYANVERIRLTLTNLQDFGFTSGTFGPWRAAVREMRAYAEAGGGQQVTQGLTVGPAGTNPGRVSDYTDIVKLLCAWAGFYWPQGGYWKRSDGTQQSISPAVPDRDTLGPVSGRVWGDFQDAGTANPGEITPDVFDKKPLMDGIAYVRDILGFLFHIDETGGVQWRLPNLYDRGNLITGASAAPGRTNRMYTIHESTTLTDLSAEVDSANVVEGIFVGSLVGACGAVVPGFNPNPVGLRRFSGWTDQNFESSQEAQVMADMIAIRKLFTYRTDQVRIPGNPGIQIDDQVRVFERVTSEGFVHYVKGISSTLDMVEGQWHYDLQTHWLGEDPTANRWVVAVDKLSAATQRYINAVRQDRAAVPVGRMP